jgi:hypothetical protein
MAVAAEAHTFPELFHTIPEQLHTVPRLFHTMPKLFSTSLKPSRTARIHSAGLCRPPAMSLPPHPDDGLQQLERPPLDDLRAVPRASLALATLCNTQLALGPSGWVPMPATEMTSPKAACRDLPHITRQVNLHPSILFRSV